MKNEATITDADYTRAQFLLGQCDSDDISFEVQAVAKELAELTEEARVLRVKLIRSYEDHADTRTDFGFLKGQVIGLVHHTPTSALRALNKLATELEKRMSNE